MKHYVGQKESFKNENSSGFRSFGIGKKVYFNPIDKSGKRHKGNFAGILKDIDGNIAIVEKDGDEKRYQASALTF